MSIISSMKPSIVWANLLLYQFLFSMLKKTNNILKVRRIGLLHQWMEKCISNLSRRCLGHQSSSLKPTKTNVGICSPLSQWSRRRKEFLLGVENLENSFEYGEPWHLADFMKLYYSGQKLFLFIWNEKSYNKCHLFPVVPYPQGLVTFTFPMVSHLS